MGKKWLTTSDLIKLPGMPKSRQGVAQRAEREGWERRQVGNRIEYALPLAKTTEKSRSEYRRRVSNTKIGDRLRETRIIAKKNIHEMAKIMEVSANSWASYETGRTVPGSDILEILAEIGFDPRWLLTGHGQPVLKVEEKPFNFPIEQITTYEELRGLVNQAFNSSEKNRAHDLIVDAYTTAFSAVEDFCLFTGDEIDDEKKHILYVQLVREYLWGRNPYDDKRIIPQIIKNLFMLVKQTESARNSQPVLVIEETGKKRKYRSFSSIDKLPTDIVNDIHCMAADPKITYEDIVRYCDEHGHKVSKSAIGRYCFGFLKEKKPEV